MNNRQFNRITIAIAVTLQHQDQQWQTQLLDLSLHGALLDCPASCSIHTDDNVTLILLLDPQYPPMEIQGRVAHYDGHQVGIEFQVLSIEAITQIRQLVQLNLGDEALLQRDFHALIGDER